MKSGVSAVIMSVVWDMGSGIVKSKDWVHIAVMIAAFVVNYFLKVNVIFIILTVAAIGILRTLLQEKRKEGGQA